MASEALSYLNKNFLIKLYKLRKESIAKGESVESLSEFITEHEASMVPEDVAYVQKLLKI